MYGLENFINYLCETAVQISHRVYFSGCQIRRLFYRYHKNVWRLLMHYLDKFMNFVHPRIDTYILFHEFNAMDIFAHVSSFYNGTLTFCFFWVGTLSLSTAFHNIYKSMGISLFCHSNRIYQFLPMMRQLRHVQKCNNMIVRKNNYTQLMFILNFKCEWRFWVTWALANQTFLGICTFFTKVTRTCNVVFIVFRVRLRAWGEYCDWNIWWLWCRYC